MNNPKKGWHHNYCVTCGKAYSTTTHYGGNKRIKCEVCQNYQCFKCFLKDMEISEIKKRK